MCIQLKSHYAFNVNKLQETKSSLPLLMGSLQSHLHIDVAYFLSESLAVSQSLNELKKSTITNQDSCVFTYARELPAYTALCFDIQIMHSVGRALKDTLC